MTSAADQYAAVYDAVRAYGSFVDHGQPGDHWAEWAEQFRLDPLRPLDGNLSAIAEYLRPSDCLVDVGGGAGRVSLAMARLVSEVVLVEPSAGMRAQFAAARDGAGIGNARITSDWWMDSEETGDVVFLSDVTYFVRDIAPFVAKLSDAAARRVMITLWRPTPGDMGALLRRVVYGETPPHWPGLPELAAALWEMGILPEIRPLPEQPWWLTDAERGLSDVDAVALALRWLDTDDAATRQSVSNNLHRLFDRTDDGLTPRWLSRPRAVLITWETQGQAVTLPPI